METSDSEISRDVRMVAIARSVSTLIEASELSSRGSGMKISCSSHSFQSVLRVDLDTGAISIVNLSISPFFMAFQSLVNLRITDSWSNTGVPLIAVM